MQPDDIRKLTASIIAGKRLSAADVLALSAAGPESDAVLLESANRLREHFFGNRVQLCGIVNARSGKCDQDCVFCAQSARYETGSPVYEFIAPERIAAGAQRAAQGSARRFSVVTSGKRLSAGDFDRAVAGVEAIRAAGLRACASLGVIEEDALVALRERGLQRYHHNLEAARSYYGRVCTTRSYADNVRALQAAKEAGLEICAGGLFGLGETWAQRAELFLDLRALDVDAVPLNFLIPIAGTPLADQPRLSPEECLRIIALARFCLPDKPLLVCGGRNECLGEKRSYIFAAGASGMMIGDLLTVKGRSPENDLQMLADLGLEPEPL